jgi:hypothetical protein
VVAEDAAAQAVIELRGFELPDLLHAMHLPCTAVSSEAVSLRLIPAAQCIRTGQSEAVVLDLVETGAVVTS